MSFYKDASLVFLPSGGAGKDTKAYSIKPRDGSGDFTFSRGSNLTATRVDSNGLIEKGRENLVLQSNSFSTSPTWSTSASTTLTSGQAGYDGSNDAWLVTDNGTSSYSLYQSWSGNGVYSLSVYAKAGTGDRFRLDFGGGTNNFLIVDLTNGSIVSQNALIDNTITSAGNGWYRISLTANVSSAIFTRYGLAYDSGEPTSQGTFYIQDAQAEIGLTSTEYIESGATTGKAGILEDSPRFDYSGGASCPSLLLEPSRTNLIGYSEYLVSINGGSVEYNSSISPEGLQNATKVIFGATTNDGATMNLSASCSGNTQYTWSAYVKNISGTGLFNIRIDTNTTTILVNQDITATSEWTRVSHTFTTDASATSFGFNSRYRSKADGNEILIWGAQIEQGSYPTSYIPNHSGGSVTRNGDFCTNSTGGVSQTEGTIFIDYKDSPNKDVLFACSTSKWFITNNIRLSYNQLYIRNSTGNLVVGSLTLPDEAKLAIKYDANGVKIFSNGNSTPIFTNSNSISFDGSLDFVRVGSRVNNAGIEEFNVDQFLIFTTALSDANCITLTS